MCIGRLKEGEAPACVQACPTHAIAIRTVKVSDIAKPNESGSNPRMLPGAFNSEYTKPTTNFRTTNPLPENFAAADNEDLTPEHEHTPLVFMLTLTQVSIGMMAACLLFSKSSYSLVLNIIALIIGAAGMASSIFHLGSPMGAWRAFLGLKKSWLSREIVVLGTWFPIAITHVALISALYFFPDFTVLKLIPAWLPFALGAANVSIGLLGIFSSVMVYVDTHREFWALHRSAGRFYGTALVSSSTTAAILGVNWAPLIACLIILIKIAGEAMSLLPAKQTENIYARKTARLQLYPLRKTWLFRAVFAATAATLVLLLLEQPSNIIISTILVFSFILGELYERKLYFGAVAALRMPGLIASRPTNTT